MSFKKTLKRIREAKKSGNDPAAEQSGMSNALVNAALGRSPGLSLTQLGALDLAFDKVLDAADIEAELKAAEQVQTKGVLQLARDAVEVYGGDVADKMKDGEAALVGARAALAYGSLGAVTEDEKSLATGLEAAVHDLDLEMDTLHLIAQANYRLPAGESRVDEAVSPRSKSLEDADNALEVEVGGAAEAVNAFNRANTDTEAWSRVEPFTGPESGRNAYVIGACIEQSVHDPATTTKFAFALCHSLDVSVARFPDLVLDGAPSVEDADATTGAQDAAVAVNLMTPAIEAIHNDDYGRELNPGTVDPGPGAHIQFPEYAEHIKAVLDMYRLHAYLRDVHRVAHRADKGDVVKDTELAFASEMLVEVEMLAPTAIAGVLATRRSAALRMDSVNSDAWVSLRKIPFEQFGETKVADLAMRLDILHGADDPGSIDNGSLPSPDDVAKMAEAIVAAANDVDGQMKSIGIDVLDLSAIKRIEKLGKLASQAANLQELHQKARSQALTDDERWDALMTWKGVTATSVGELQKLVDTADGALEGHARRKVAESADWDGVDDIFAKKKQLKRLSKSLGKVTKVTDALNVVNSGRTLISDTATLEEKADAAVDLAGVAIGGVSSTAGGLFSLGVAYVQLIRSEFKRIAAIEKKGYAGLASGAFGEVTSAMGHAERLSARLVAAEKLVNPDQPLDQGKNERLKAMIDTLGHKALYATKNVHGACMSVTDTDSHVSEALVGWTGTQKPLRKQYLADVGKGPELLDTATAGATTNEKLKALRRGGGAVFSAAGDLAESVAFYYDLRMNQ